MPYTTLNFTELINNYKASSGILLLGNSLKVVDKYKRSV